MRMDYSGAFMIVVGTAMILAVSWFSEDRPFWVIAIGSAVSFLGWLAVISGAKNVWLARKHKQSQKVKT